LFDFTITSVVYSDTENNLVEGMTITMGSDISSYKSTYESPEIVEGNEYLIFSMNSKNTVPAPFYRERYCDYWICDPFRLIIEKEDDKFINNLYFF